MIYFADGYRDTLSSMALLFTGRICHGCPSIVSRVQISITTGDRHRGTYAFIPTVIECGDPKVESNSEGECTGENRGHEDTWKEEHWCKY